MEEIHLLGFRIKLSVSLFRLSRLYRSTSETVPCRHFPPNMGFHPSFIHVFHMLHFLQSKPESVEIY